MLLLGLLVVADGCNSEDTERLAGVARAVAAKSEALTGTASVKLPALPALQANLDELTLEARIGVRLRWDKTLAGTQIQVQARDGVVELRGKVNDLEQRRRAVQLAETTLGAGKVSDQLEVPETIP
jgi:hypothetical protein